MSSLYVDNIVPNLGSQVQIPNLKPLAGSVVQVVQGQTSTQVSTSVSASYTDTGLQASITPTSASNKILVIFNITVDYRTSTANFGAQIKLFRDATEISMDYVQGYYASSGTNDLRETRHHSQSVLDSPSTTSSVTYKVQGRAPTQSGGISEFNWNSSVSSITLMEIAQ